MTAKLAIVVGHTKNSPGAEAVAPISQHEYEWNKDLALMMTQTALQDFGPGKVGVEVFYRDGIGITGAYNQVKEWGADAAMELHFNAFTPTANGSETLYVTDISKGLAQAVQAATVATLGLKDRGVKTPQAASGGRGQRSLSQMGPRPSILTEPFFGSNEGDAAQAQECKRELAAAQVSAAINYLLTPFDNDDEREWVVTASSLNIRGGPGVEFEKLGWGPLNKGAKVALIKRYGDWFFVAHNGGEGFVHSAYLA